MHAGVETGLRLSHFVERAPMDNDARKRLTGTIDLSFKCLVGLGVLSGSVGLMYIGMAIRGVAIIPSPINPLIFLTLATSFVLAYIGRKSAQVLLAILNASERAEAHERAGDVRDGKLYAYVSRLRYGLGEHDRRLGAIEDRERDTEAFAVPQRRVHLAGAGAVYVGSASPVSADVIEISQRLRRRLTAGEEQA
jgi:hypothetical protein